MAESDSSLSPPPEIEMDKEGSQHESGFPADVNNWTKEQVHEWLLQNVKVDGKQAERFLEEDVSGDSLVRFKKQDFLDLELKNGPAVKIISHLERLKEGSQHESGFPAYVENWTKKQVHEWLLQNVKVDGKQAERFLEEDVSGDCLVWFTKQDFLDLELKNGPAVKILKQLHQLKNKPKIGWSFKGKRKQENPKTNVPLEKTPEKDQLLPSKEPQRKETVTKPALLIKDILDNLLKDDLKNFCFQLQHYLDKQCKPIPLNKLEGKDTIDIATLVTDHYGSDKALRVTQDVLEKINQRELAADLKRQVGGIKCVDEEDTLDTVDTVKPVSPSRFRRQHTEEAEKTNKCCFMMFKINLTLCSK